jgi:adenylate cyclase
VRLIDAAAATLTIKSRKAGLKRLEFEFPIPLADAEALLALRQGAIIEKIRHSVHWHGRCWEIDVFEGENAGLVIAEIELQNEHDRFDLPPWLGAEITGQERYYNSRLVQQPFCTWAAETRSSAEPAN